MSYTDFFISGVVAAVIVYFFLQWKNKRRSLPPGPWNLPVFGYLLFLDPKQPYLSLMNLSKKYGPIYGLHLGSIYTVVISDVKLLKQIFFKDAASGRAPLHLFNKIMGGRGVIFTEGSLWKDQRKLVHNFLRTLGASRSSRNRNKMEDAIMRNILDFVQNIKKIGNRVVLEPRDIVNHNIGLIMSNMTLGKSWKREDKTFQQLLGLVDEGSKLMGVAASLNFLPFLRFLPHYKANLIFLKEGVKITHDTYEKIIGEKKNLSENNSASNLVEAFIAEKSKRVGTADAESFYNDQQLYFLLSDIFGAGIETTANSMLWFLLFMAVHQEVQNKVREELSEALNGNLPTLNDLPMLPYTQATIAEVSRIRTVVPLGIPHGTLSDLVVDGFTIPNGTMILPLMWAIHMDPKVWDDPERFRPERFLDGEGNFYKPEAFIPFEIGKRMCVGEEFAKMNLFLFGATLVQKFKIECESKVDLIGICGLTLSPKPHELIFTSL